MKGDKTATRRGATVKVLVGDRFVVRSRHAHRPAGAKLARMAAEHRATGGRAK